MLIFLNKVLYYEVSLLYTLSKYSEPCQTGECAKQFTNQKVGLSNVYFDWMQFDEWIVKQPGVLIIIDFDISFINAFHWKN